MNKKKSKLSYLKPLRLIVQLLFLVLLPGLYSTAFLGIKLIYQSILQQNFSFSSMLPQLISAIAIIPLTLLFGRFFCGWMCAFGTLGDLLYLLSQKVFKIKFKINEKTDKVLKYVKYIVLAYIVIVAWTLQSFNFTFFSPWDAFGNLLSFTRLPDFSYVITNITVGFILLLAIMAASLFIERFFCRYLCPLGAVFAVISHLKFIKIKKPSQHCGSCKACTKKCSMGIPLYHMDRVSSGECINCMKCLPICPRENMSVEAVNYAANPALTSALAVTAIAGVYYIGTFTTDGLATASDANSKTVTAATKNSSIYTDGTYEGSGTGFRGATTTVSVTINSGVVTGIEAVSYGDDKPFFDEAFNDVVSQIITKQSSEVDAVSGATFSSNGIMEAVADALESAKGDSKTSTSSNASNDSPTVTAKDSSTESANDASTESTKDASTESAGNKESTSESSTSASSKYQDGDYKGSAKGFQNGTTTVSVSIKNDVITDISVVSNEDTPEYFDYASPSIISKILDAQSTDVDAVSGATYSSMGIMNAVEEALSSAVNK